MDFDRRSFLAMMGGSATALMAGGEPAEAAVPFRKISTFLVTRMSGNTRKASLAARPGGGFAAIWERDTGVTYDPSYSRYYNAAMQPVGLPNWHAETTYQGKNAGDIICNPDGTANVFWYGFKPAPNGLALWWMQRLSATGAKIGAPVKVYDGISGDIHFATRLSTGNLMCAWVTTGPFNHAKVYTPGGAQLAYNPGNLCNGQVEAIAALPSGGEAVAAYYGPDLKVAFQILSSSMTRKGRPVSVPSIYAFGGVAIAKHKSGFVSVWKNYDANGNPVMQGGVFSATGARLATLDTQMLSPDEKYNDFNAVVLGLADGRTVVVTERFKRDPTVSGKRTYSIIAYLFGANGKRVANPMILYAKGAQNELWAYLTKPRSLIRLSDGTFLFAYDGGYEFSIEQATAIRFALL
jgi:hypothetical protein